MKKISMLFLCLLLFIIQSGCLRQTISVPSTTKHSIIVSHLNQPLLSFVDKEEKKVIGTTEIENVMTDMVKINNGDVIFTDKNDEYLYNLHLESGKIERLKKVGKGINQVLFEPGSNLLFLADSQEDKIHFFDVEKKKVITSVSVGSFPVSMEFNQRMGHLYVTNTESSNVSVIDIYKKEVIFRFPVIERPSGIVFDGELLWIGGHGPYGKLNEHIYIYDPATGKEIKRVKVGLMPIDLYSDLENHYIYSICHGSHQLIRMNSKDRTVDKSIEVGANPNALTGDQHALYVTSLDEHTLSIINRKSLELEKKLELKTGPYKMVFGGEED